MDKSAAAIGAASEATNTGQCMIDAAALAGATAEATVLMDVQMQVTAQAAQAFHSRHSVQQQMQQQQQEQEMGTATSATSISQNMCRVIAAKTDISPSTMPPAATADMTAMTLQCTGDAAAADTSAAATVDRDVFTTALPTVTPEHGPHSSSSEDVPPAAAAVKARNKRKGQPRRILSLSYLHIQQQQHPSSLKQQAGTQHPDSTMHAGLGLAAHREGTQPTGSKHDQAQTQQHHYVRQHQPQQHLVQAKADHCDQQGKQPPSEQQQQTKLSGRRVSTVHDLLQLLPESLCRARRILLLWSKACNSVHLATMFSNFDAVLQLTGSASAALSTCRKDMQLLQHVLQLSAVQSVLPSSDDLDRLRQQVETAKRQYRAAEMANKHRHTKRNNSSSKRSRDRPVVAAAAALASAPPAMPSTNSASQQRQQQQHETKDADAATEIGEQPPGTVAVATPGPAAAEQHCSLLPGRKTRLQQQCQLGRKVKRPCLQQQQHQQQQQQQQQSHPSLKRDKEQQHAKLERELQTKRQKQQHQPNKHAASAGRGTLSRGMSHAAATDPISSSLHASQQQCREMGTDVEQATAAHLTVAAATLAAAAAPAPGGTAAAAAEASSCSSIAASLLQMMQLPVAAALDSAVLDVVSVIDEERLRVMHDISSNKAAAAGSSGSRSGFAQAAELLPYFTVLRDIAAQLAAYCSSSSGEVASLLQCLAAKVQGAPAADNASTSHVTVALKPLLDCWRHELVWQQNTSRDDSSDAAQQCNVEPSSSKCGSGICQLVMDILFRCCSAAAAGQVPAAAAAAAVPDDGSSSSSGRSELVELAVQLVSGSSLLLLHWPISSSSGSSTQPCEAVERSLQTAMWKGRLQQILTQLQTGAADTHTTLLQHALGSVAADVRRMQRAVEVVRHDVSYLLSA